MPDFREALQKIAENLAVAKSVEVGFLEEAHYPDGKSVALVAALNEFGHSGTPPRPFFRRMISAKSRGWSTGLRQQLIDNNYESGVALSVLGAVVTGQLQESINALFSPPLAPSTIKRKGFSKPLIETAHMLKSVDYRVKI